MKKRFFIFIATSLLFISCANDIQSPNPENYITEETSLTPQTPGISGGIVKYVSIHGSFNYIGVDSSVSSRTAMPDLSSSTNYYAIAKCGNDVWSSTVSGNKHLDLTITGNSYLLKGIPATNDIKKWIVEFGIRTASDASVTLGSTTNKIVCDTKEANISSEFPVYVNDFVLKPISQGTGILDLGMTVPAIVTSVTAQVGRTAWGPTITVGAGETTKTVNITSSSMNAGSYNVAFSFFNAAGMLLYRDKQTVNIVQGCITNNWINNGGDSLITNGGAYVLEEDDINDFARKTFYVGNTLFADAKNVENGGSGSAAAPLDSLTEAIGIIAGRQDSTTAAYTIYISGTITGTQTISESVNGKAASITLCGINNEKESDTVTPKHKLNGNNGGSTLTIATTVPVIIEDLLITGGNTAGNGGGIAITNGNVELTSGVVVNGNTADIGGGVYLNGGNLYINGSAVVGKPDAAECAKDESGKYSNKATTSGGGIAIEQGCLWLGYSRATTPSPIATSGGVIYNLVSRTGECHGGGIDNNNGTINFANGNVSYNYACSTDQNYKGCGGGISTASDFNLSGNAKISNNQASYGGAVFITDNDSRYGKLEMGGGEISSNKAEKKNDNYGDGGGVAIGTGSSFIMSGGILKDNVAENAGGAVLHRGASFEIKGNAKILAGSGVNNRAGYNDIGQDGDYYIKVSGATGHTGSGDDKILVTPSVWTRGKQIFAAGNGVTITDDMLAKFSLTDSAWKIVLHSSVGKLDADIYVSGTSANDTNGDGTASNPYGTLATAISKCWDSNKNYTIYVKDTLTGNQEISGTITAKSITLQGTGTNPSIDANQNGRPLLINTSKEVTIKNLSIKNGKLTTGNGGGISVAGGCTLTLDSGAQILSNDNYTANTSGKGGGIYIAASNTVIMKSGSLVNLNKAYQGGGIYNEGKLLMYGTARIGTAATSYPQNPWATPPRTQTGNCSFDNGGGVYNKGTLCLGYSSWTDGSTNQTADLTAGITGNFSKGQGGGVYIDTSANLYFNTGNISYNRSSDRGAGVYIYSGFMTMSGGSMTSNCHDGNLSGAIHVNGTLNMSGSVSIPYGLDNNDGTWNTSGAKNNLYVDSGKIIGIADGFANSDQTIEMKSAVTSDGTQLLDLSSNSSPVSACTFFSIGTGKVINREGKIESGYVVTASTVDQVLNDITSGSTLVVRASNVTDIASIAAAIKNKPGKTVSLSLTQILSNSLLTLDFEDTCSFMDCTNITSVTIDGSKIRPYRNAFGNCINLTLVTVVGSGNVVDWGSWSFKGCTNLQTFDFTACSIVYLNGGSLPTNGGSANPQTTTIKIGTKLETLTFSNMDMFTNPSFMLNYSGTPSQLKNQVTTTEYEREANGADVKCSCSDGTTITWKYQSLIWQ